MLSHQHVVAAYIGLALDTIQDQVLELAGQGLHEFLSGREYGTAKPDDATLQDPGEQGIGRQRVELGQGFGGLDRLVRTVAFDDDARCRVAVAPVHGPALDRDDLARRGRVHGSAEPAVRFRDQLAF